MRDSLAAQPARIRALLVAVLLTGLTTFMLLPLLALYLTRAGLSVTDTGIALSVLAVTQQGLPVVLGPGIDRWGSERFITVGLALRVLGYPLLGLSTSMALATAALALIGTGGAMMGLAIRAELGGVPADDRRSVFALRGTSVNLGAVLGPLLGALALQVSFAWIVAAATLSHLALHGWLRRRPATATATVLRQPRRQELVAMLRIPAVVGATGAATLFWVMYSQLSLTVPLFAASVAHTQFAITYLFVINAVLVVALQYPIIRRVPVGLHPTTLIAGGLALLATAYLVLWGAEGWTLLVTFILLVSLGEILLAPALDDAAVAGAPEHLRASSLGLTGFGAALGSLLGTSLGGQAFEHLQGDGRRGYWLALALLATAGAVAAAATQAIRRHERLSSRTA